MNIKPIKNGVEVTFNQTENNRIAACQEMQRTLEQCGFTGDLMAFDCGNGQAMRIIRGEESDG